MTVDRAEPPSKRQRTRDELLDAARRVIARKGLLAATIVDIADEAGRAPATLYTHFASKQELAHELARQFDSDATQPAPSLDRHGTGDYVRDNVHHATAQFWQTFADQLAVAVGAFQLAMVEPGFAAEWADVRRAVTQRFARAIQRLQERGVSAPFDAVPVASAISGMLFHAAIVDHFLGANEDAADSDDVVDTLAEIWFRSVTFFPVRGTQPGSTGDAH